MGLVKKIDGTFNAYCSELPMWLEAILSREDLERTLRSFTPLTLSLGAHGGVRVDPPTHVELVPAKGLRAVCGATVHGSLFGVDVPVTISAAQFLLVLSITRERAEVTKWRDDEGQRRSTTSRRDHGGRQRSRRFASSADGVKRSSADAA